MGSITDIPASESISDQPSVDERRALVERIAASTQFKRSARLRDFLLYVGRQSLIEGCPEINEQEIGTKVFGRSPSYIRSQDNIVRVNATELRKRIEVYFSTEGAHESLVLDIPRGGYKPVFHRRLPSVQNSPPNSERPQLVTPLSPDSVSARRKFSLNSLVWAAVCILLAITCVVLLQQNRAMRRSLFGWEGKPAVASFWGEFLRSHQQTDIILADASVTLIEDIVRHPISLGDYLTHDYMRQIQSSDISPDRKVDIDQIFNRNLISFGDLRAAQQILALTPVSSSLRLTLSRYYVADSIKRDNVILIGGKKANPWTRLFDDKMNFSLDYEAVHSRAFIVNRNPQTGEEPVYVSPLDPNTFIGYSVIAYLPNPSHSGNAIILAGTDSDATYAAAEFLTSEEQLQRFRSVHRLNTFPYFEILLKTSRVGGTSFSAEPIAFRLYPDSR